MIVVDGIEMRTAAQWAKKHRAILKRQLRKGVCRTWNTPGGLVGAEFYSVEQTRPYNKRELQRARKARRDLEKTRKARLSCRCCGEYFGQYAKYELNDDRLCEFCERPHTAWQWLYHKRCAPKKGEEPVGRHPVYRDAETDKWKESGKEWYYYGAEQVSMVPDKRYEKLKDLYIKMFGGWEEIDLENTKYDGHKWW